MNRLVCTSRDDVRPEQLPPARREPDGPTRVLFVHGLELGFGTTAKTLEHYAAARDDIDAVHFSVVMPRWLRAACARSPVNAGGWDFHAQRMTRAWGVALRRWIGVSPGAALPLERFDVVHVFTRERAMPVVTWAGKTRTRFVVNVDTTLVSWDRDYQVRRPAPKLDYAIDRRVLGAADAVACASRWALDSCVADHRLDPARLFLHRPCVRRAPGAGVRRHDPLRNPDRLRIGFVGNDWARKGGPRLLRWHQERWADRAELHVCSGEAPADRAARNVVWHGRVPHGRLVGEVLPSLDLLVIPTWEDTFLIAAQEAQLAGLPVVTTRLAGIPEVVLDGRTGLLCARGDDAAYVAAAERLMDDAALRARMGAAALEHADRDLNADVWHNHLLDQLVRLARGEPVVTEPQRTAGAELPRV